MNFDPFPRTFYDRSAQRVAAELLGHFFLRREEAGFSGGIIVETEAYLEDDAACHAAPGWTPRNRVMFGPPGHAYVYFIYGCHFCANAVCLPPGRAEAVLFRAVTPDFSAELMRRRRGVALGRHIANGPGKLCQAMSIRRDFDGADLCDPQGHLMIAANPARQRFVREHGPVAVSKRIGITKCAGLPLRFFLSGSDCVSGAKRRRIRGGWP